MKSLLFLVCFLSAQFSRADVVVSLRYFKAVGVSHYHLFLFRDDGKLIRQLTSPEDAHDVSPRFTEEGKAVLFTRREGDLEKTWRIGVDGKGWRETAEAPVAAAGSGQVGHAERVETDELKQVKINAIKPGWEAIDGGYQLGVPGSEMQLILRKEDMSGFRSEGFSPESRAFQALVIREPGGREKRLETDHGEGLWCDWMPLNGSPFLLRDGLRVAFYEQHTGSTYNYRVSAIDLLARREVVISKKSPAILVPHGARAGFFSVCEERYQPLPKTTITVNCLYLDWWGKDFKRVRFAKALSLFGGASVRVKGEPQLELPFEAEWRH